MLAQRGIDYLAAPVSGNAKVIKAGKLSFVCSGPRKSFDEALPLLRMIAPAASYVGEGELARIVKICHNVFLGVVIQSLAEITVLAQKAGVPRHAFLEFLNQSVMGSMFTRYKTPAFVNLDFKVTFTPELLRKDLDLGLDAGRRFEVPMPLAALTRDLVQSMIGRGMREEDFAALLVQQAQIHFNELTAHITPFNRDLIPYLAERGLTPYSPQAAPAVVREIARQAQMLAFNDIFWFIAVVTLAIIPLLFLMKRPERVQLVPAR